MADPQPPKLLDQVRQRLRVKHYSIRTEDAYIGWIRRYILFHGKRHPKEMGENEISAFLTQFAVEGKVSASTQNQVLCALLFLYGITLGMTFCRGPSGRPFVKRKLLSLAHVIRFATALQHTSWKRDTT